MFDASPQLSSQIPRDSKGYHLLRPIFHHAKFHSGTAVGIYRGDAPRQGIDPVCDVIAAANDKVKDWRVMPLVLAVNYGEYDPKKYLELLERTYHTIVEGLLPISDCKSRPKSSKHSGFSQAYFEFALDPYIRV